MDAATKAGLLDLIDGAVDAGWSIRRACRALEVGEVRTHRWYARRARGRLADQSPGGFPMHGILPEEAAEILALFEQWGEVDRSHRKLAHRGSYLSRVWVSPSTVRRVLHVADLHFRPRPRPGRSKKRPFPEWADYTPNSIWIFDTTHFTRAGMAVLIIEDLVSRKWITEIVSVEETSTQVELAFTAALQAEGLLEAVDARHDDGRVDISADDQTPTDPARRERQRTTDDLGVDPGVPRPVRDRSALRPAGHPDRPGLDRAAERDHQDREPAPARHPRPGHATCRARRHTRALQHRPTARRDRLRHPRRRTRGPRRGDP
ncbi:MAG: hypothetical protein V9E82_00215 [Candidatus Nanopelagicales bacterium]